MLSNKRINRRKKRKTARRRAAPPSQKMATTAATNAGMEIISRLGKEATIYAASLVDPFVGPLPTLPSFPPLMTKRQRIFIKGTLQTGTGGFGFALANPRGMLANNDAQFALVTSTSTYAGTVLPAALGVAGVQQLHSNSEYAVASFSPTALSGRVVTAALRIRYAGTTFNQGGFIVGVVDKNHQSLAGFSLPLLLAYDYARELPAEKKWTTIHYKPVLDIDDDFIIVGSPTYGQPDSYYMGFGIQDATGGATPLTYEFDFTACVEFTGFNIRGLTLSVTDMQGYSAVTSAAAAHPEVGRATDVQSSPLKNSFLAMANHLHSEMSGPGLIHKASGAIRSLPTGIEKLHEIGSGIADFVGSIGDLFL